MDIELTNIDNIPMVEIDGKGYFLGFKTANPRFAVTPINKINMDKLEQMYDDERFYLIDENNERHDGETEAFYCLDSETVLEWLESLNEFNEETDQDWA